MCAEITISPMTVTDIPSVVEIEGESQPEPWSAESFREELGRLHSHLLVARLAQSDPKRPPGRVVGYVCYWCVADEIQILNIAVHREFRRRRVGRCLLAGAIRAGCEKKAGIVSLEVRKSNVPARRLYEGFGFTVVGERPNYYGVHREPAILMELEIAGEDDTNDNGEGNFLHDGL